MEQPILHVLSINEIKVLEGRGRKTFKGIKELAESIKKCGLISPLCVNADDKTLLAGERRLRALKILPVLWTEEDEAKYSPNHPTRMLVKGEIPVTFRHELPADQLKEIELEENVQREKLEPFEEIALLSQIHEHQLRLYGPKTAMNPNGVTLATTAEKVDQDVGGLSRKIAFHKDIEELKKIDPATVEKLSKLPLTASMKELARIKVADDTKRMAQQGLITLSNDIVHADCVEYLRSLPEASFNCSITDVPFGIPELAEAMGQDATTSSTAYKARLLPDDNLTPQAAAELMVKWAPEIYRVLKPSAHCWTFFSFEIFEVLKKAMRDAGFLVTEVPIIWNKGRMTSPFKGYDPAPMYEPILLCHKPPRSRRLAEPCGMVFDFKALAESARKIHPFQKSPELLAKIIKLSTNEGESIIDSFAGSGETVKVAKAMGRSCLGIEKSSEHFHRAQSYLLAADLQS